jgi:hypothetical protein
MSENYQITKIKRCKQKMYKASRIQFQYDRKKFIFVITFYINVLHTPIKRHKLPEKLKGKTLQYAVTRNSNHC